MVILFQASGKGSGQGDLEFDRDPQRVGGSRQGMPEMPPAFCIAIHPEARALDAELAQAGGCARFIMDDGYACGPPRVVFPALERFICRLQIATNLVAQRTKFAAHSPTFDLVDYAPLLTLGGMVSTFTGPIAPGGPPLRGHGLLVGGVPIGDAVYVQQHLHIVTTRIESYSQHLRAMQPLPNCFVVEVAIEHPQ